ncbi:DEAD-box ATP-dependent RNA helicase 38 [Camellia lanceoleosa]|uniref:DEAD-box ATP-dependent RNA helicase 38 n=1 Tax=Camellia lanceoleosa TaxID=1840588 RepID=A0ACC0H9N0_9ERIC|nr:DEAD-box ATP-dependent RNA helicase 38 [Camellia lanceoleosa]
MKFERPSKIQTISLPMILTPPYKHLIAQAHNGSGKTTCFVLGMLSRVDPKLIASSALRFRPTRELAIQNMEVLKKMGNYTGITSKCAIPMDGSNYVPISKRAPVTAQVVIGTPGTINKWATTKKLSTDYLKILVFDEANHMLVEGNLVLFQEENLNLVLLFILLTSVGPSRWHKPVDWVQIERKRHDKERTLEVHKKLVGEILKRDQKKRKKIEAAGIDYECPEIVRI